MPLSAHAHHLVGFPGKAVGVPFRFLEQLRLGQRNAGHQRDVIGNVVAAQRHASGGHKLAVQVKHIVCRARSHVNKQSARLLDLPVEHKLGRGNGGENHIRNIQRDFPHATEGVGDAGFDSVDDMAVDVQGSSGQSGGIGQVLLPVHGKETGHAVQDELFRPQGDVPGDFRHLVHMLLGNNAFIRGKTERSPVVLPHNMGACHGQIDGHDIHVRMVLGHIPGIVNALDDLGSVFNLSANHALARNLTHADDCHGRIWLHFAYDHASLACPYLKPYVNFCLSHENQGTINVLAPDSTLLSIIQESLREHTQKTRFSSALPRFKGLWDGAPGSAWYCGRPLSSGGLRRGARFP